MPPPPVAAPTASVAVQRVLRDVSLQSDLHSPYFYRFLGDPARRQDERVDEEPYRQEHFVVPTVPILLSIIARLGGDLLADRRCGRLLHSVLASIINGNPAVVPAQPSGANGTVNMMYLHEALGELHDASRAIAQRSPVARTQLVLRRYRPTRELARSPWFSGTILMLVGAAIGALIG